MSITIDYNNTIVTWSDLQSLSKTLKCLSEANPCSHYIAKDLSLIELSCMSCFFRTLCCCPCGDSYNKSAEGVLKQVHLLIESHHHSDEYAEIRRIYSLAIDNFRKHFQDEATLPNSSTIKIEASKQAAALPPTGVQMAMTTVSAVVTAVAPAPQQVITIQSSAAASASSAVYQVNPRSPKKKRRSDTRIVPADPVKVPADPATDNRPLSPVPVIFVQEESSQSP